MKLMYGNLMNYLVADHVDFEGDHMGCLYNCVFITTNAYIQSEGKLVMGRGIAKTASLLFKGLPLAAAAAITKQGVTVDYGVSPKGYPVLEETKRLVPGRCNTLYGVIPNVVVEPRSGLDPCGNVLDEPARVGLFQVKFHWQERAHLTLVEHSAYLLADYAKKNPDKLFALNYPAIGNGGRKHEEIEPLISILPDNVHVWQFSETTDVPPNQVYSHPMQERMNA